MSTITKQQVLDRRRALDQTIVDTHAAKQGGRVDRVVKEQIAARRQLVADCEASSGHVFPLHDIECLFCGAPKNAGAQQLARNLTRTA